MILQHNYDTISALIKENGTKDEYENQIMTATVITGDINYWLGLQKLAYIFDIAWIILFIIAILIASYKLYYLLLDKIFVVSVAFTCLVIVIIGNLFKAIYFCLGPLYLYDILPDYISSIFIILPWPIPMFTIMLVSLFWEEALALDSFKKKPFLKKLKVLWITFCVAMLLFEIIVSICLVTLQDPINFAILLEVDLYSHIVITGLQFIYCIVNTIRMAQIISMSRANESLVGGNKFKQFILSRVSVSIIIANFGHVLFCISLVFQIVGYQYGYSKRYLVWFFLYLGQYLTDMGIMFAFKEDVIKIKSDSTSLSSFSKKKSRI